MGNAEDSTWEHLPHRFRVRQVLFRAGPAGAMIADDLKDEQPALVRVIPVSWLESETLDNIRTAHQRLGQLASEDPPRTAPLELVLSDRVAFVTRRFLPGQTLSDWHPRHSVDVHRFTRICLSAVESLAELHARGILHGNLKASNVCVSNNSAAVLDYGLYRWNRAGDEVAALAMDPRQDMTCLGAVLLETGRELESFWDVARSRGEDYEARSLLRAILGRLATPAGYHSLAGVASDLASLIRAGDVGASLPTIGAHDVRHDLAVGTFIARPDEWNVLTEALEAALTVRAQSVLIEGSAGIGKTRLLEEFATWAEQERGARVAYIKSDLSVAPRPHLLLGRLVHELRRLHELAPTGSNDADDVDDVDDAGAGTPFATQSEPRLRGEVRVREAAQWFVHQLNPHGSTPVIVVIDDCHFTRHEDRVLVSALAEAIRGVGPGAALLFAHRGVQEGSTEEPAVSADAVDWFVRVDPLPTTSVHSLVRSMTGQVANGIVEQVSSWVAGNPLAAQNAVRFLVDTKAIVPGPDGWQGTELLPMPPMVLHPRIRSLPPPARRVLQVAAVIGNQGPLDLLARAAYIPLAECRQIVGAMAQLGLLRGDRARLTTTFAFAHDTVRETFLSTTVDTNVSIPNVHAAVAQALRELGSADDYDLAFHLAMAGRIDEAHPHAVRAARAARSAYSLATARQYFEIALRHRERWGLLNELGEVLMLVGSYPEAAVTLARARDLQVRLNTGPIEQARTLDLLGRTHFKMGALQEAERQYVRALEMLGQSVPRSTAGLLLAIARELAIQSRPAPAPPAADHPDADRVRATASVLGDLMYCMFFHDSIKTLWAQARELTLVRRCAEDAPERGHAFATQAIVYGCILGMKKQAARAGEAAMAVRDRADDAWGNAHARHLHGAAMLAVAEPARALELITPALERFDRTADRWEAHTARWHRALALYRQGEADQAAREARETRDLARSIGDRQNWILATMVQTLACDGDTDDADDPSYNEAPEQQYDIESVASMRLTRALRALRKDDLEAAAAALDAAVLELWHGHVLNAYVAPVLSWRATVTRWRAERADPDSRESRILTMKAVGHSCVARLVSVIHANERDHASRELRTSTTALARRVLSAGQSLAGRRPSVPAGSVLLAEPYPAGPLFADGISRDQMGVPASARRTTILAAMEVLLRVARADRAAVVEEVRDTDAPRVMAGALSQEILHWLSTSGALREQGDIARVHFQTHTPLLGQVLLLPLAPMSTHHPLVLVLEKDHPAGFSVHEREAALYVRDVVARALQMEDAAAADAAAAIMREEAWRTRLASDLHDEVGQRLSASLIEVRRLENFLRQNRTDLVDDVVKNIGDQLMACNRSVRSLVYETSPPSVAQFGLVEAVRDLVERASESAPATRFSATITRSEPEIAPVVIPPSIEIACFRIIQEAVTNVIKHAEAGECTVMLTVEEDVLSVIVEDDGAGLQLGHDSRGFGLVSMRERAAAAGGVLHLSGRPGAGSTVSAMIPLNGTSLALGDADETGAIA